MNKIDRPKIELKLVPEGIKVRLTKVSELVDAECPNNIPTGDTRVGYVRPSLLKPIIGMRYGLESVIEKNGEKTSPNHWFITSEVTIILFNTYDMSEERNWKGCQFTTRNSIYKVETI